MPALLLIYGPEGTTREVKLDAGRLVLGRAAECEIVVENPLISRRHAGIIRSGAHYVIEDLGSHNGTTINGRRISASATLRNGDRIELAGVARMTFVEGDATVTAAHAPARGVWLDEAVQDVWVDGFRLDPPLSTGQYRMLQLLVANVGQVCTRDMLVAAVWPQATGVSEEALDALIKRVRARLGNVPNGQRYLTTLRGRGLILHRPD